MPNLFIITLGCFVIAMLWLSGAVSFGKKPAATDPLTEMRTLLQARAEGKIGQEEFERAQAVVHLAILQQPAAGNTGLRVIFPVLAVISVLVLGYYAWTGKAKDIAADTPVGPHAVAETATMSSFAPSATVPAQNAAGDLGTAVKHLEAKLEKNPDNRDGWLLLARSYTELGRTKDAEMANAKAAALQAPTQKADRP